MATWGQSKHRSELVFSLWCGRIRTMAAGKGEQCQYSPPPAHSPVWMGRTVRGRATHAAEREVVKKPHEGPIDAASRWMVLLSGQTAEGRGKKPTHFLFQGDHLSEISSLLKWASSPFALPHFLALSGCGSPNTHILLFPGVWVRFSPSSSTWFSSQRGDVLKSERGRWLSIIIAAFGAHTHTYPQDTAKLGALQMFQRALSSLPGSLWGRMSCCSWNWPQFEMHFYQTSLVRPQIVRGAVRNQIELDA